MNQKSESKQTKQVKLLAPHTRIAKYIREAKRFLARTDYASIKRNRIELFRNLLEEDCEQLCGTLRGKVGCVINHIIYTSCVGGITTTSMRRLSEVCNCSPSTVGRAIDVLRASKQYLIGYENEVRKGRYIIVDTLCEQYGIVMDYVFGMHKSVYTKMAYNNTVKKGNQMLSEVLKLPVEDAVGRVVAQLERSNRLGNYVSFSEIRNYIDKKISASSLIEKIRSRILDKITMHKQAIANRNPLLTDLYDLMVSSTSRLDILESIPKFIVRIMQLTNNNPTPYAVRTGLGAFVEMSKNFMRDDKLMYTEKSLPHYFEVVYKALIEKDKLNADESELTLYQKPNPRPNVVIYNWLDERE